MIKIHFPHLREQVPIDLASAVLGLASPASDLWGRRFNNLHQNATQYFCSVSEEEAEIFVYPYRYELNEETIHSAQEAQRRGLECLFFTHGDDAAVPEVPLGRLYRHSLFADKRSRNEFAMPAFTDDILSNLPAGFQQGLIHPRKKQDKPTIGFRGYVGTSWMRTALKIIGRHQKAEGLILRHRLLKNFHSDQRVNTQFEKQNHFSGGKKGITHHDPVFAEKVRNEYITNLLSSDYTLCVRGAGNFSYRFYEVLSAGRIPVFVNTKCVLPFEDEINWKKHCVWIELEDLTNASAILRSFHEKINPQEFIEIQKANRKLWEDFLTPLAFYRRVLGKLVRRELNKDSASDVS